MASLSDLHIADFVLFALTLLVSLAVGIYHGFRRNKQQTTEDFLLGGRNLQAVPVAISMFMSYVSGVLVLGNTAEMYTAGIQYWLACIGSTLAFLFAAWIFVPLFYPLKFTSGNEYYEARFGSKVVRVWSAIMYILSSMIYMGLAMYTPATALHGATQFPIWGSILATGVVATIYTTLGGIRAVVWTDTVQGGILVIGIIAVLIIGSVSVGGLGDVWNTSEEGGRLKLFDFNPDPTVRLTFWSVIFGRFFISLNYVAGQTAILRYSTLRSMKDARLSALLNIPGIVVVYTLTCLCGLTVYSYYAVKGCDPIRNKEIRSSNQLLPYFIMESLNYPGIPGVFFAVLFSGALSSISSSLNAMAACTWKDLLEWRFKGLQEKTKALINKVIVAVYGVTAIIMAFIADFLGGHVLQATQSLVGGFGGPGLGLFFLGSFFPWANWQGALFGSLIGFGMTAWVSVGAYVSRAGFDMLDTSIASCSQPNMTDTYTTSGYTPTTPDYIVTTGATTSDVLPLYKLSYMYTAAWGCLITVIAGLFISLITGCTNPSDVEPELLVPVIDKFCCCLPARWRQGGHCGVAFQESEEEFEIAASKGEYISTTEDKYTSQQEEDNSGNIIINHKIEIKCKTNIGFMSTDL